MRGTRGYLKRGISLTNPREEISRDQGCQVYEASYPWITRLEVRDSSYLGLFSIWEPSLALWSPRVCLVEIPNVNNAFSGFLG